MTGFLGILKGTIQFSEGVSELVAGVPERILGHTTGSRGNSGSESPVMLVAGCSAICPR